MRDRRGRVRLGNEGPGFSKKRLADHDRLPDFPRVMVPIGTFSSLLGVDYFLWH